MNNIITNILDHIDILELIIFGTFIIIFIIIFKKSNNRIKNIKETQIPRRFKYLDTFYFNYNTGDDSQDIAFNVIEDLNSNKIYAMINNNFEKCNFVNYKEPKIVIGSGFIHKMPKIEFNQEGNLWIEEELLNAYNNDNNIITINYKVWVINQSFTVIYDKKNNLDKNNKRYPELFHLNQLYDISLLDKAIFITGIATFDNYK